jgi:hypothetical protein
MSNKNETNIYDVVPKWERHLSFKEREDGLIELFIPRFHSNFSKRLLERLGRDPNIHVTLEEHGSTVWRMIDGKNTVRQIVDALADHFNHEENYEYRIIKYIMMLKQQRLITYDFEKS